MTPNAAIYPSQVAYQDALQNPALAFTVPELRRLVPLDLSPYGLPSPVTGQFANVYRMAAPDGSIWAAKLFLRYLPQRTAHYRELSAFFQSLAAVPDWYTPLTFYADGIRVGAATFPVALSPWVGNAVPLNAFVDAAITAPDTLHRLRGAWRKLIAGMEAARFAHGDLQHGNVLVSENNGLPRLHLLDYDGAWVPALAGTEGAENGHPAYQHPARKPADHGLTIDRFAVLAVDSALTILTEAPELWYRFDNGDNLLWRREDFAETRAPGRAFSALTRHGVAEVRRVSEAFRAVCESPVSLLPDLERFVRMFGAI